MIFAGLVLLSALLIEIIGTFISISGLGKLFADSLIIMILAGALDFGKVMSVSFLHRNWRNISWIMKGYMTTAVVILMIITSTGCFGYLSAAFQHAIAGQQQQNVMLVADQNEQTKLQARKKEIDAQVSNLPASDVKGRRQLSKTFGTEVAGINARLTALDKEIPELQIKGVQQNSDVGPIIYIAQAFNTDATHAVKWVILTIIFVFDPLAIALLLAGNYLIEEEEKKKLAVKEVKPTFVLNILDEDQPLAGPMLEAKEEASNYEPQFFSKEVVEKIRQLPTETEATQDANRNDDSDDRKDKHQKEDVIPEKDSLYEAELNQAHDTPSIFSYDPQEDTLQLGRHKARDRLVDHADHVTDDQLTSILGRRKDRYVLPEDVETEEKILRPVLNEEGRPVITMKHVNLGPIPRSSLEDVTTVDPLEALNNQNVSHSTTLSNYME